MLQGYFLNTHFMKLKTLLIIVLAFSSGRIPAQNQCFKDCEQRAVAEWEKLKARGITSTDSALLINQKILENLKGCAFPNAELDKLDDGKFKIEELKGNAVFVHFWFTNCATCIAEMPSINQLYQLYENKKVKFLAISFNDLSTLKAFSKTHGAFRMIQTSIEQKMLEEKFCVLEGYPLNLVLDKNGKVVDAWYEVNPDNTKQEGFYNKVKELIDKSL